MKFTVAIILVLLPLLGFSQDEMGTGVDPTHSDEAVLEELSSDRVKRGQAIGKIENITEAATEFDPTAELKKLGYDGFTAASLMNKDVVAIMEKTLKEAKLHTYPPEVLREQIVLSMKGSALEGFIIGNPSILNFLVDLLRDEKALNSTMEIFKNKERLKTYLYIWIAIMFMSWYTKSLFVSKYWKGSMRFAASIVFSITISTITLSSFCLLFKEETRPIIALVKRHL